MQIVYTPDEVADLLGLDRDVLHEMADAGRFSGFYLDRDWRISPWALLADLRRIEAARRGFGRLPLAALAEEDESSVMALALDTGTSEGVDDDDESFQVSIEIVNATAFSGDFLVRLVAEGDNDTWKNFDGVECELSDAEITIQKRLGPGESISLFDGTLRAHVGDRLFLTAPEQLGVDVATEKVYVLDGDLDIRLTLAERGLFGKRSTLQFE